MPPFHKVYVFEPNPRFHNDYHGHDVILIPKAIWTTDTLMPFYLSKDPNQVSSSLIRDKLCRDGNELVPSFYHEKPIEIQCINFSKWIESCIKPHHRLTLKLDIEGAEYEVLWDMIRQGTITKVWKLFVEFHWQARQMPETDHLSLVNALRSYGVEPHPWD